MLRIHSILIELSSHFEKMKVFFDKYLNAINNNMIKKKII